MILVFGPNESINRSRANELAGVQNTTLLTNDLVEWAIATDQVFYSSFKDITTDNFSWLLEHGANVDWQHDQSADPYQYLYINLINKFCPGRIDLDPYNLCQHTANPTVDEILFYYLVVRKIDRFLISIHYNTYVRLVFHSIHNLFHLGQNVSYQL